MTRTNGRAYLSLELSDAAKKFFRRFHLQQRRQVGGVVLRHVKSGLVSASVSGTSVATISGGAVTSLVVLVEVVRKFSVGTANIVVVSVVVLVVVTAVVVVVVAAVNDTKF